MAASLGILSPESKGKDTPKVEVAIAGETTPLIAHAKTIMQTMTICYFAESTDTDDCGSSIYLFQYAPGTPFISPTFDTLVL